MSTEYYQKELHSLRVLAADFAKANPSLAPHLSGPSPDPDVERLLEGVAFLTGAIRQKLDDEFQEFAQSLMQIIFPHFLRPLPSSTIIQFSPKNILQAKLVLQKGTYIDSKEIEGVSCRFSTCYDVDVYPMQISSVRSEELTGGKHAIFVDIDMQKMSVANFESDRLSFYIGGDYSGASDLFLLLQGQLKEIHILDEKGEIKTSLPPTALKPKGVSENDALIPYPKNAFPAYRLLQEYYLLKEKLLFLELTGLDSWVNRSGNRFTLRFDIQTETVNLPRLGLERFTLHATPAINLFDVDSEPMLLDQKHAEVKIRPRGAKANTTQVYSVNNAYGQSRGVAKRTEYKPFNGFSAGNTMTPSYQITHRVSGESKNTESWIGMSYPPEYSIPDKITLMMQLTCTNGNLPSKLRPGDICKATTGTSELVDFSNITPPSDYQPAPSGGSILWRLLSHLSLNYLTLANSDNLKALLSLYIFPGSGNKQNEVANCKRIESITAVSVNTEDRLVNGHIMRGHSIKVSASRDYFASEGDYYLFGTMLNRFIASYASINAYTTIKLSEPNTGVEYQWEASLGGKPLL